MAHHIVQTTQSNKEYPLTVLTNGEYLKKLELENAKKEKRKNEKRTGR